MSWETRPMSTPGGAAPPSRGFLARFNGLFDLVPYALVALFARFVMFRVFFLSGQSKVEGTTYGRVIGPLDLTFTLPTHIREQTFTLFRDTYKVPLLPPNAAAWITAIAEHVLPVLLLVGLFSRFAALGLLTTTAIIQIFIFPEAWWTVHVYWVALLSLILFRGPGAISLDALFGRRFGMF